MSYYALVCATLIEVDGFDVVNLPPDSGTLPGVDISTIGPEFDVLSWCRCWSRSGLIDNRHVVGAACCSIGGRYPALGCAELDLPPSPFGVAPRDFGGFLLAHSSQDAKGCARTGPHI